MTGSALFSLLSGTAPFIRESMGEIGHSREGRVEISDFSQDIRLVGVLVRRDLDHPAIWN
jgi:hypothetical protein